MRFILPIILIFSSSSFAHQSPHCVDLFAKKEASVIQPQDSSWMIDNLKIDIRTFNIILRVSVLDLGQQRLKDWSLVPLLAEVLKTQEIKARSTDEIYIKTLDFDGTKVANIQIALDSLASLINRKEQPASLREVGDFDKQTRLEAFQQTLPFYSSMNPARFRTEYLDTFIQYTSSLPLAMVAALRTEYVLEPTISKDHLAVQIIQSAYGGNSTQAIHALEVLKQRFLGTLVSGEAVEKSAYIYGLVPPVFDVKTQAEIYAEGVTVNKASDLDRRIQDSYKYDILLVSLQAERDKNDSYVSAGVVEAKRMMLDDLPYEIIDISVVHKLRSEYGITTVEEFARRVTGPMMMYDLGLTRNEIRDLYYYMRENHRVYLNLTESFGLKLGIFNREYHQ